MIAVWLCRHVHIPAEPQPLGGVFYTPRELPIAPFPGLLVELRGDCDPIAVKSVALDVRGRVIVELEPAHYGESDFVPGPGQPASKHEQFEWEARGWVTEAEFKS